MYEVLNFYKSYRALVEDEGFLQLNHILICRKKNTIATAAKKYFEGSVVFS